MTGELTVGLLGAGMIAGVHAHAYRDSPGVRLAAVADPVPGKAERIADRHGAKVVPDLYALLDLGVDVVDICTPPTAHANATIAALQAGRHVLCEKPITRTMDEARRVLAAAEAAPGLLSIGQVARYGPDHRLARDLAASGEIGLVRMLSHSTTTSLPGWSEGDGSPTPRHPVGRCSTRPCTASTTPGGLSAVPPYACTAWRPTAARAR
nr:Gfo/Idh/MocA family oxidoreductase [Micromonospora viridifaciens]